MLKLTFANLLVRVLLGKLFNLIARFFGKNAPPPHTHCFTLQVGRFLGFLFLLIQYARYKENVYVKSIIDEYVNQKGRRLRRRPLWV